jgi:uncharacterized phage-associated protein
MFYLSMASTLQIPAPVRKSTQALNYFAHKAASGAPMRRLNKMKALKLLFFADRYHLRKYGRSVSDCAYFAMKHGPVASEAKNIAEESPRLDNRSRSYAKRYVRKDDPYHFSSVGEVDDAVLSKTDEEALDFAWQNFGHYSEFRLRDITHHYPEWKRHARALNSGRLRVGMKCSDFFDEPEPGYNPCHELSKKDREIARELYLDSETVANLWK